MLGPDQESGDYGYEAQLNSKSRDESPVDPERTNLCVAESMS